jgi:two-component system catabolic regulation response regulator CreB
MQSSSDQALVAQHFDYCVNAQPLGLTAVEFKILRQLLSHSDQVFSREQLMVAADMTPDAVYERNIDSHIKAIRHKLKPYAMAERIVTKRGFGYFYNGQSE